MHPAPATGKKRTLLCWESNEGLYNFIFSHLRLITLGKGRSVICI